MCDKCKEIVASLDARWIHKSMVERAADRYGDRNDRVEAAVHISGDRSDNLVGAAVRSGDMIDKGEGAEYTSGVSDNIN